MSRKRSSAEYDVVVVGSGFGGSVTALRPSEKNYTVGVLETGRRWTDEDFARAGPGTASGRPGCGCSARCGSARSAPSD